MDKLLYKEISSLTDEELEKILSENGIDADDIESIYNKVKELKRRTDLC